LIILGTSTKKKQSNGQKSSPKKKYGKRKPALARIKNFDFQCFANQLRVVIHRYFPNLLEKLELAPDTRKYFYYNPSHLIMACISLFLLRQGSRNVMNQNSQETNFQENIKKLFGIEIAHFDTINTFFKNLETSFLDDIKHKMLQIILSRKVLNKYRLFEQFHLISIDGTSLNSTDTEPYNGCPHRDYSNNRVYIVYVLEAKLVCSNGFCLSIATEWLLNENEFDKQDCEKKAFTRLCTKLRETYPKLPICIISDGLFIGEPNIILCKKLNFRYIFTFKDDSIPNLHKEFNIRYIDEILIHSLNFHIMDKNFRYHFEYFFSNDIHYREHDVNMFQCIEYKMNKNTQESTKKKFLYVTDLKVTIQNIQELTCAGRMRWKIENEGFNTQKNLGYNLKHKFNRKNLTAMQNYYQCLQIAHIIEQLLVKSELAKELIGKRTIIWIWRVIVFFLIISSINEVVLNQILKIKKQYIY